MTGIRAVAPLLLSLTIAVAASVLVARADGSAAAARMREEMGLTRGRILDRHGAALVFTADAGSSAQREYALPDLSTTIGYRDPRGRWHGLEGRYTAYLDAATARADWRTFFLHLRGRSAQGANLRLTMDSRLQRIADAALGNAAGAVVALDPRSGDVLAMVSKPSCQPRILAVRRAYQACLVSPDHPLLNRATQLLLPPGSSFKIVTLSAALDTRTFTLRSIFSGADVFGPSPYFDNVAYPSNVTRSDLTQLTLAQALAFSDNFTFAHVGLTLGAQTLLRYAHRFYVGRRIPFVLPAAVSRIAQGHAHPSRSELARSSFGAAVDRVTPLQMALIASAVADHGVLMAPRLIEDVEAPDGTVLQRTPTRALGRVMSPRSARSVTDGMVFVVDHGSGFNAQIRGIRVAGKTGTAASGGSKPHAWFIAFAPAYHPVIAVAVLHEFSGEGFQYAAPIAHKVLLAALQQDGYRVR